jgi:hypothetical protein
LDFMGAAAGGADSEFCASAAGAATANSAVAIVTAIRLLMNLPPAPRASRELSEIGANDGERKASLLV